MSLVKAKLKKSEYDAFVKSIGIATELLPGMQDELEAVPSKVVEAHGIRRV